MQIKKVRNQMWVFEDNKPVRQAKESEVKRWATTQLIERLQADSPNANNPQNLNLKSV